MRFCCLNIHMSRTCHGVVAIVVPICKSAQHVIRSTGATKLLVWRGLRMADEGEGPPSSQAWIFPGLTGLIPMATPGPRSFNTPNGCNVGQHRLHPDHRRAAETSR